MVSKQKEICYGENGIAYTLYSFRGLSTDTKPTFTELGNGSTYLEMDTGKVYFYNADGKAWIEV